MSLLTAPIWTDIEMWDLSYEIGVSWWFPLLESIHVIAITLVLGAILMVDLRLLGLAARQYSVSELSRELTPWAWLAFVISTITGLGMFITRAASHVTNPAFQWKMVLLALAGLNMAFFHFAIYRHHHLWENNVWENNGSSPANAKVCALLSLLLWISATLAGRWVGHLS